MARFRWFLCLILALILILPSVSATISVHNIAVVPSGALVSGQNPPQEVKVSYYVTFIPEGGLTFGSGNTLGMSTDLDNPRWSYSMVLDGNPSEPTVYTGKNLDISGWVLSYPSRRDLSVTVNLTGEVPALTAPDKKTLVKVGVYNGGNEVYPGSAVTRTANITVPGGSAIPQATTAAVTQTSAPATHTTSPDSPSGGTSPGGGLVVPVGIITVNHLLLVAFIPLGLLIFRDHFGIGYIRMAQSPAIRAAAGIGYILAGAGLLFVLVSLQEIYASLLARGEGAVTLLILIQLLVLAYTALSSFALSVGTFLSRAFGWTLRIGSLAAFLVLVIVSPSVFILGPDAGISQSVAVVTVVTILASLLTLLISAWQTHTLRTDLGSDWVSRLSGIFGGIMGRFGKKKNSHGEPGSAISILNTRLAKGEIDLEEYKRLKDEIRK